MSSELAPPFDLERGSRAHRPALLVPFRPMPHDLRAPPDGPLRVGPVHQHDVRSRFHPALPKHPEVPTRAVILEDDAYQIRETVPAREGAARGARRRDLDPHVPDREDVAEAHRIFGDSAHRQVLAEPAGSHVLPAPLRPPARVMLRGVHEERPLGAAVPLAIELVVSGQALGAGPDRALDRFLPDRAGPGPLLGILGVRGAIGAGLADLNGFELHARKVTTGKASTVVSEFALGPLYSAPHNPPPRLPHQDRGARDQRKVSWPVRTRWSISSILLWTKRPSIRSSSTSTPWWRRPAPSRPGTTIWGSERFPTRSGSVIPGITWSPTSTRSPGRSPNSSARSSSTRASSATWW